MLYQDHKDIQLLEALDRAKDQQDFCRVLGWLRSCLETQRRENDYLEGVMLNRSQGCCLTLQSIITAVETSSDVLRKMRDKGR